MPYTICADFGSTFTKLCVMDLENGELVMTTKHPTTVGTDASIALLAGIEDAKRYVGDKGVNEAQILASSSAAGGLRMVVIGLTRRFSLLAGRNVALGAGARVICAYTNLLTSDDIREIEEINPEIILITGGVEGGNTDRILHNVGLLKKANVTSYVVYAGNHDIASYVRQELKSGSIECYIAENVFPAYGALNPESAGEAIRQLFMNRIVGAKGLASAFPIIGHVVMSTPAAVLEGGKLLSRGTESEPGLGGMMTFDVGGATTDVYSYSEEKETSVRKTGAPEPYAKRTVEGDLGVRSSCMSLAEAMGEINGFACVGGCEALEDSFRLRASENTYVPDCDRERNVDSCLAGGAVKISARRHCGKILNAYAKNAADIVEGKDLIGIRHIVGTGGPIIHSSSPREILGQALRRPAEKEFLLPDHADLYLDKKYILYAIGMSSSVNPEGALYIAKKNITKI